MSSVNHPEHYNLPGKKECIEQMREDYGNHVTSVFCLTNAYKYLYRAGHKGDKDEDIDKAIWYFNYANDKLFSAIQGSKSIKLYEYIKSVLKNIKEQKDGK